jgi:hypothetical protein
MPSVLVGDRTIARDGGTVIVASSFAGPIDEIGLWEVTWMTGCLASKICTKELHVKESKVSLTLEIIRVVVYNHEYAKSFTYHLHYNQTDLIVTLEQC